jgi:cytochrome c biogenesis protein CcdA
MHRTRLAIAGLTAAGLAAAIVPAAHAVDAPVATTLVGVITVSTPPVGAVLVPPVTVPGNAVGTDLIAVVSNTPYHITVRSDRAKLQAFDPTGAGTYGVGTLAGALALAPAAAPTTGATVTNVSVTTSDQTIVSNTGSLATAYTLGFTQPVAVTDPLGLYRATLTYTVSSGV